jgi:hypothetical protein
MTTAFAANVAADAALVTAPALAALGLLVAFFAIRPELWARLFFARVDPRPGGLLRLGFGLVVLWTFLSLALDARLLFTDEGLWLPTMARARYGGPLRYLWDPVHGFEHWWSGLQAAASMPTVLHLWSHPVLVFTLYGLLLVSISLMTLGAWTRWTTIATWLLAEQIYRYNPIFYTGGDFVVRAFLFLGMLSRWGEAYSVDSWRRRRRAILAGAPMIPPLRRIPAWPFRLMMLQLACIYCASGLLKSGATWRDGTALYYVLNLDHFYRVPAQGVVTRLQYTGVLSVLTWATRWWEILFPLALVGAALRGYEMDRAGGVWPVTPPGRRRLSHAVIGAVWLIAASVASLTTSHYLSLQTLPVSLSPGQIGLFVMAAVALAPLPLVVLYRRARQRSPRAFHVLLNWVLGKRVWLVFGLLLHLGIDAAVNVGTFSEVMIAVYLAWLSGAEIDAFWRYLFSRPVRHGEGSESRGRALVRLLNAPFQRLVRRDPGPTYSVHYHPDEPSVRRAALLRLWDLGRRLEFVEDPQIPSRMLRLDVQGEAKHFEGARAAAALTRIFPGLWWLRPAVSVPGLRRPTGALAQRILGQA